MLKLNISTLKKKIDSLRQGTVTKAFLNARKKFIESRKSLLD